MCGITSTTSKAPSTPATQVAGIQSGPVQHPKQLPGQVGGVSDKAPDKMPADPMQSGGPSSAVDGARSAEAVQPGNLPPGLARRLAAGRGLPPGLEKKFAAGGMPGGWNHGKAHWKRAQASPVAQQPGQKRP